MVLATCTSLAARHDGARTAANPPISVVLFALQSFPSCRSGPAPPAALLGYDVATFLRFYVVGDDEGAAVAAADAGRLFAV